MPDTKVLRGQTGANVIVPRDIARSAKGLIKEVLKFRELSPAEWDTLQSLRRILGEA